LRLQEDIQKDKQSAHIVILSLHWGVRYLPKIIATYQPQVAHAAIDAGADLILGHHPHILKAVETYKGKVCFYGIGNFLATGNLQPRVPCLWNLYWYQTDPKTPLYAFPIDGKKSFLVKVILSKDGVVGVSMLPAYFNEKTQLEAANQENPRFNEILRYMEWVSDQFPHSFRVQANEIVIQT